jgi:hypothetical protein
MDANVTSARSGVDVRIDGAFEVRLLPLLLTIMQPDGSVDRVAAERLIGILEGGFPDTAQRLRELLEL